MTDIFDKDFFVYNRQKLKLETGAKLIVLSANGLLQRSADTTFNFRQDSNFWYLTGIEEPDFILVIDDGQEFLIAPKRSEHRDQWDGVVDIKLIKEKAGINQVYDYHEGWNILDRLIKKHRKVHTITPVESYFDHFGFYANPARGSLHNSLSKHRKLEMVDIRKSLARLRQIKQDPEILAIKTAIDMTVKSLSKVKRKLLSYKTENQIVADLTRDFIRFGANGHAYNPIVATGKNATVIHYIKNDSVISDSDLVLMDVGAEFCNYSADITRTYSVNKPSKRQTEIYRSVMYVRNEAMNLIKPGLNIKKYEKSVDEIMAKELVKLGLLDDIKNKKKLKKYYPHLTSHFLGLDTHDAADYELPIAPGMVLTVEPGIYIPEEDIGIRIEDDVLVTENGIEVLSDSLPVELY